MAHCSATSTWAQTTDEQYHYIPSVSSPQGNYLLLYMAPQFYKDSSLFNSTSHFIVERLTMESPLDVSKIKKMGEVRPASSMRQLRKYINQAQIAEVSSFLNLSTPEALLAQFQADRNPTHYSFAYQYMGVQMALGQIWLDEDVDTGKVYQYHVFRVDKNGKKEFWGMSMQAAKAYNAGMFQYKTYKTSATITDSTVYFSWASVWRDSVVRHISDSVLQAGYNDEIMVQNMQVMLRLYVLRNGILLPSKLLLGIRNSGGDSISVHSKIDALPGDEIVSWVVPEDMVGNQGHPSDTAFAFAVAYKNAPIIAGITVAEVTDGVRLSWERLPARPYVTGVRIQRYNSNDKLEDVALLPPSDTSFIDYSLHMGQTYRYQVSTVFAVGVSFKQQVPAQGAGAYTIFSKPMPPANLRAAQKGTGIRLDWDSAQVHGFFGYHVYRAHDGSKPELLAGPVTATGFTDTSAELSGRSVYTYTVLTQNVRQDTSLPCEPVSITPHRAVALYPPAAVTTYYANGRLSLSWDDTRLGDSYITGYQLQKRSGKTGDFRPHGEVSLYNQATDSALLPGIEYEYRVASVGARQEVSPYSLATLFVIPKEKDHSTVSITVRNTYEGVAISWPDIERHAQKQYVLYRRIAGEQKLLPLARLPLGSSAYTDKKVTANANYVYAIALEYNDGTEGPVSDAESITYRPEPKPEILN